MGRRFDRHTGDSCDLLVVSACGQHYGLIPNRALIEANENQEVDD